MWWAERQVARQAGPPEDACDVLAGLTVNEPRTASVADETTSRGELAAIVDRRDQMLRCECHDLRPLSTEKWVVSDEKRADIAWIRMGESRFDLRLCTGLEHLDCLPHRASGRLHVVQVIFRVARRGRAA